MKLKLINHIRENRTIKQSLYPDCGGNASSSQGGGQRKSVAHRELANLMFVDDRDFGVDYAKATTPKLKTAWGLKVKNCLADMEKTCRAFVKEMGETGAGIACEEDINMNVNNSFTNRWQEIKAECPWFFEMRDLIAERPNQIRSGLGNSASDCDITVLLGDAAPAAAGRDIGQVEGLGLSGSEGGDADVEVDTGDGSNNESDVERHEVGVSKTVTVPSKRKIPEDVDVPQMAPRTPARSGSSKPVTSAKLESKSSESKASSKKRSPTAELVEAAKAEEATAQSHVELAKVKLERSRDTLKYKRERLAAKTGVREKKLAAKIESKKMAHEFKMARVRMMTEHIAQGGNIPSVIPSLSPVVGAVGGWPGMFAGEHDWTLQTPGAGPSSEL
ncbi:hypothetical protein DENSPDRAFT_887343 [Dentipellis sp. KUC8613]|nr:hypothetical protein DENSPDRAFT_887343 [Dentipellis sp. KUC8613]